MSENPQLVGIAQMKLSNRPTDIIVAPNLGSCLGISAHDPVSGIGGMVHCLLPLSKADPQKAADNPCMYVDTGLALLLEELMKQGADRKRLRIVAVGGANIHDEKNVFEIGKRNYTVLKKILWKNNLTLKAEHVGDSVSRTLTLFIESGRTTLKMNGETVEI